VDDELLTVQELLAELRVPRSTWYQWRQAGKAPRVVEAEAAVIGWLAAALPALGFLACVKIVLGRTIATTARGVPDGHDQVPVVGAQAGDASPVAWELPRSDHAKLQHRFLRTISTRIRHRRRTAIAAARERTAQAHHPMFRQLKETTTRGETTTMDNEQRRSAHIDWGGQT